MDIRAGVDDVEEVEDARLVVDLGRHFKLCLVGLSFDRETGSIDSIFLADGQGAHYQDFGDPGANPAPNHCSNMGNSIVCVSRKIC